MNIKKNLLWLRQSALTILGLTVSIAISLLIVWYVGFETSFDKDQPNYDRIYRVTMGIATNGSEDRYAATGELLGEELTKNYPAIETYASFKLMADKSRIRHSNKEYFSKVFGVNNDVFKVFSYQPVEGRLDSALTNPASIVLTQSLAHKLFGDKPCINEPVTLNNRQFAVTAVIRDIPYNADLRFDALVYVHDTAEDQDDALQSYFDTDHYTFILAQEKAKQKDVQAAIDHFGSQTLNPLLHTAGVKFSIHFRGTPLSALHFSDPLLMDTPKGNATNLYILSLLALFLLVIGIANFVNYNIVISYKRAAKIGLKRLCGITNGRIVWESTRESVLGVVLALCISVAFLIPGMNYIKTLEEMRYVPDFGQILTYLSILVALMVLIGCLGGIIPARHMTRQTVGELLRNKMALVSHKSRSHKVILFLQVTVSAILIILTLELHRQLRYFSTQDLGFNGESVLVIHMPEGHHGSELEAFRNGLLHRSGIRNVSFSGSVPGEEPGKEIFYTKVKGGKGKRTEAVYTFIRADDHYLDMLGIPIVKGRNFDRLSDGNALVVTLALMKKFSFLEPGDIRVTTDTVKNIVGVIKDFHQTSLRDLIGPVVIGKLNPLNDDVRDILVKTPPGNLAFIENEWKKLGLDIPFDYYFLSDYFNEQYEREDRLLGIFIVCAAVAIVISCLGVFSISAIVIRGRTKELAIRSVLGSTVEHNFALLAKPFLSLVMIAFLVVCPLSYWFIQRWRENYAYSSSPSAAPYIWALLLIVLLISVNIGYLFYRLFRGKVSTLLKNE
jgi:putative ABC transport system permease protein